MPPGVYVDVDGKPSLLVKQLTQLLRDVANKQAADLGEQLHHATFIITRDPDTIRAWGQLHDCEQCAAAVQRALRYVRDEPGELIVGQLFWAAPA